MNIKIFGFEIIIKVLPLNAWKRANAIVSERMSKTKQTETGLVYRKIETIKLIMTPEISKLLISSGCVPDVEHRDGRVSLSFAKAWAENFWFDKNSDRFIFPKEN